MSLRKWILTSLLLLASVLALAGPLHQTAQAQDQAMSRVRFLHAVPGAPDVDVYLDGVLAVSSLTYGEATPHLHVAAGDHQVAVRAAGSGPSGAALFEVTVPLTANLAFMVVVQGTPDAVSAAQYEDILDELQPGMARLTAVNAIADAPGLDVLTSTGGPLLQGVSFGAQFGTVNIGTGLQDLVFVPAGGGLDGALATIGQVPLESNTLYTFVALGTLNGTVSPSTLVLATPVNGAADSVLVRVAHGSPDAGTVDVYANDVLIAPALEAGDMSGHLALPAGAYTLSLRAAGSADATALVSKDVTLDAGTPAVTVVAMGEAADSTLDLQVVPDTTSDVSPEQARIAVINAVPGATVSAALTDEAGTALAANVAVGTAGGPTDVAPGVYMLTVNVAGIATPVDVLVPEQEYVGGSYYTVLVFGGGAAALPVDARVAGTDIAVAANSFPTPAAAVVEAVPTVAPTAVVEPTQSSEVVTAPTESSEVVPPTQSSEVVAATPTQSGEVVAQAPTATSVPPQPLVTQQPLPVAYIELDPGANLHCRELPKSDARSLGLIPAGATVTVIGRTGLPLVPDTGLATAEPTPVVEKIEDLWLSVQWDTGDGGYLRCWVSAQFLRVEFKGKLLDTLEELMELPEEPFNRPGEAVNTTIKPPTPVFDAVLATVNLEPGVSLQLRRNPNTQAEALDRVPAGAQLEVLGYIKSPSEGLVGQPTDPRWLRVRYRTENSGATVGWISAQYVTLSRLGRPVEYTEIPLLTEAEPGLYEQPGVQPVIPIEQQAVLGVVNLNPGANLNLRDRPSADAFIVRAIPAAELLTINGRNGDGTWVQATYETPDGTKLEGWAAAQYLVITRGGQPYDVFTLPNLSGEPDVPPTAAAQPTVAEATPAQ